MGEPQDQPGQCNAHCYIADNYGDNHATMRCQLPKGHEGLHQEAFTKHDAGQCILTWTHDERADGDQS